MADPAASSERGSMQTRVADPYNFDADPACHFDADPDPTLHFDADPDPSFQIKAQNLEKKCSNRLIFHTFWLVICKLMRIRIQLITLMRIWIRTAYHFDADPDPTYHFDADPDPTVQFDADPCGSRSTTLIQTLLFLLYLDLYGFDLDTVNKREKVNTLDICQLLKVSNLRHAPLDKKVMLA